jgi:hypothetical protein
MVAVALQFGHRQRILMGMSNKSRHCFDQTVDFWVERKHFPHSWRLYENRNWWNSKPHLEQ